MLLNEVKPWPGKLGRWAEGKIVLTANFFLRMLMKYKLDTVSRHVTTGLAKGQKEMVANNLRKWLKKNKSDPQARDMANLLYSIDGSSVE